MIYLDIKLYPKGIGSNYLDSLCLNEEIEALIPLGSPIDFRI